MFVKFDECCKVRYRSVVYSKQEAGASVYFEHISSFISDSTLAPFTKLLDLVVTDSNHFIQK